MPERQLRMIRPNLDGLPDYTLPSGYEIRTYLSGDEASWAEIMNTGIGADWTAERCAQSLTGLDRFRPDGLFFVTHAGQPVGSACSWMDAVGEQDRAQVHMVCVLPEHRGKGLGEILTLAVLHYMRDQGFSQAWLGTDDFRIPAVKAYLSLGFVPDYLDESHRLRWADIFSKIGQPAPGWRHARPEPYSYRIREAEGNRALLVLLDHRQREAYDRACRTILSALAHLDIPYRVLDLGTDREPAQSLASHQALLLAQESVGDSLSESLARQMVKAVHEGVGFISVDHRIDRYPPSLFEMLPFVATHGTLATRAVTVPASDHFITRTHTPELRHHLFRTAEITCVEVSGDADILMETDEQMPGLVTGQSGAGRLAQYLISPAVWSGDTYGHCEGLDDLFWKSIVWASRKPFVMKAMPPFVSFRVQDATGAADGFDWVRPLVDRGWRPHIGVLTEEVHENEWRTMARLTETGRVEWFPQSLTAQRAIYYHHASSRPYGEDELQACMTQAKARFDRHGIPVAHTLNAHRGEYGRLAVPLLVEWNVRYSLGRFIPNEPHEGEHLNWEPAPYGHPGYILDSLFGYPDLFVAAASLMPAAAWRYVDDARTRYVIDMVSGDTLREPEDGQPPTENVEDAEARAPIQNMRRGLDSRFYGAITLSEKAVLAFSPDGWEHFLDRVDALLEASGAIRMSQDFICAYAKDKVQTHLACADYDAESDALNVVLSGKASMPLHIQVFDDANREHVVAVDAFKGRLECSVPLNDVSYQNSSMP